TNDFAALFGDQFNAVGGEKLVVADRGGNGARAAMLDAGLHVIISGAACLERIDPHRLLARQSGGRRDASISALELEFAGRTLWRELELLLGGLQQVGDDGNGLVRWTRWHGLRRRIDRPLRAGIDWRLGQHIVLGIDRLVIAPLGIA